MQEQRVVCLSHNVDFPINEKCPLCHPQVQVRPLSEDRIRLPDGETFVSMVVSKEGVFVASTSCVYLIADDKLVRLEFQMMDKA